MKEIVGDIWNFHERGYYICIPTNGFVKYNSRCVMGRGLALECVKKFEDIDLIIGRLIKFNGNVPNIVPRYKIITFPTKPSSLKITDKNQVIKRLQSDFNVGDAVPGWACKSDLEIIKGSAHLLKSLLDVFKIDVVYVPQIGCGYGELSWVDVKSVIEPIFKDERFIIVKFEKNVKNK